MWADSCQTNMFPHCTVLSGNKRNTSPYYYFGQFIWLLKICPGLSNLNSRILCQITYRIRYFDDRWTSRRLESPGSNSTLSNYYQIKHQKHHIIGHLCGKSTGDRWIPLAETEMWIASPCLDISIMCWVQMTLAVHPCSNPHHFHRCCLLMFLNQVCWLNILHRYCCLNWQDYKNLKGYSAKICRWLQIIYSWNLPSTLLFKHLVDK